MPVKVYIQSLVLAIAFLSVPLFTMAQVKPVVLPTNANHQIEYIENITVANTDQSVLFRRALNWLVTSKAYKFKKIDLLDNSFGRMLSSGRFVFNVDEVFLSLAIDVKDNKAQLKVTKFDYNMMVGNVPYDNLTNSKTKEAKILIPQVSEAMKILLKSFRDGMMSTEKI